MIEDSLRDTDAAGFGDALEPGRNVDAVSKNVMGFDDDVTDIEPHTEENAPVFRVVAGKCVDAGLKLHGSPHRFDCTWKLSQKPVAGVLHDAAAVLRNCGLDTSGEKGRQLGVCRLFVIVHEPRIAGHVGGQDR
ncbi:hypothetical protein LRP30_21195 [Bradyrhizobium sp. C-145]|uniref:hypothetical protein n=1 Tax=Bradyrhizobium sp. C-145 TaxID=574727 RepID=UPI00201B5CC5|nr:hypothetical protein [Bradyrhizobium sp. C-145]UQR67611.1 hypothetical protein LRP30_21195 [Bradyrhizobium sp. C-145]